MLGNKKGLTLIEVLLSMVIISLMMGAVVIIYTGALRNWNWMDPKLLLQQEATIAMNKIERQLKKAGTVFVAGENSVEFLPLPEVTPANDDYTEALYHMEGNWDDSSSEHSHTGTPFGDPTFTNPDDGEYGESGKGGKFDGDDDYIDCADNFAFGDNKLTLEAWVQPHIGSGGQMIMNIDSACRLYLNDSDYLVGGINSGSWHYVISNRTIARNNSTWSHVSLAYDGSAKTGEELQLHINGHNVAAEYAPDTPLSGILSIGKELTPDISYFHGVIDEVRISNNVRRTKIFWGDNPEDKATLAVNGVSHQLADECNTDTFVITYYDGDYNEVTDTSTQENRNSIRIVKVLLGLEKDGQKFSLENTIALRKEEPAEGGGGGGWSQIGELPEGFPLHSLLMGSDGNMYAGSWEKGTGPWGFGEGKVFKSEDNGETWSDTGSLSGTMVTFPLAESPTTGSLFAGVLGLWGPNVFKTTDGGAMWAGKGPAMGMVVYSLLAASDGFVYAGAYSGGRIWRSKDDGENWTNVANLKPIGDGTGRPMAFLEDFNDGSIYVSVTAGGDGTPPPPYEAWIYKSTDKGDTWDGPIGLTGASNAHALLQDSDGNLYAGAQLGPTAPPPNSGGVFKSTDGGVNWNQIGGTLDGGVSALIEASDGNIYATYGEKIGKSSDGGVTWKDEFEISGEDGGGFGGGIIEVGGDLYAGAHSGQDPITGKSTGQIYKRSGGGGGSTSPYIYQWEEVFE